MTKPKLHYDLLKRLAKKVMMVATQDVDECEAWTTTSALGSTPLNFMVGSTQFLYWQVDKWGAFSSRPTDARTPSWSSTAG